VSGILREKDIEGVCMTWRQRRILDQVEDAALLIWLRSHLPSFIDACWRSLDRQCMPGHGMAFSLSLSTVKYWLLKVGGFPKAIP